MNRGRASSAPSGDPFDMHSSCCSIARGLGFDPSLVDGAPAALRRAGFEPAPSPDVLPALRSPEGHRVLFVRRTGHVQQMSVVRLVVRLVERRPEVDAHALERCAQHPTTPVR